MSVYIFVEKLNHYSVKVLLVGVVAVAAFAGVLFCCPKQRNRHHDIQNNSINFTWWIFKYDYDHGLEFISNHGSDDFWSVKISGYSYRNYVCIDSCVLRSERQTAKVLNENNGTTTEINRGTKERKTKEKYIYSDNKMTGRDSTWVPHTWFQNFGWIKRRQKHCFCVNSIEFVHVYVCLFGTLVAIKPIRNLKCT